MGKTYRIRTIYGPTDVHVGDFRFITDTPQMRRLIRISELGYVSEVYPEATHNRFQHSLGTLYLAQKAGEFLGLSDKDRLLLEAYALTHDIGHGPESHLWEFVANYVSGEDHKSIGLKRLEEGDFLEALKHANVDVGDLIQMHKRENPLSRIVHDTMGVDKLDYVWRDRHECAIEGGCDMINLLTNYCFEGEQLSVDDRAKMEVRDFLHTMLQNYHAIYMRKPVEIVKVLKLKAIYHAVKAGNIDVAEGWQMDDAQLRIALFDGPPHSRKYMDLIETRRFPKAAGVIKLEGYTNAERLGGKPIHIEAASRLEKDDLSRLYADGFDIKMEKIEELESRVAERLGMDATDVLITFPRNFGSNITKGVKVHRDENTGGMRGPSVIEIGEIFSDLDSTIQSEINSHWAVRLCVPQNKREEAYKKIKNMGLRSLIIG